MEGGKAIGLALVVGGGIWALTRKSSGAPGEDGGGEPGGGSGNGSGVTPPLYGEFMLEVVPWRDPQGWRTVKISCNLTNPNNVRISPKLQLSYAESYIDPNTQQEVTGQGSYDFGTFDIEAGAVRKFTYDGTTASSAFLMEWGGGQVVINWNMRLMDDMGGSSQIVSRQD